jgi:glycosyltransferase involved in cell wall biosynthesis
LEQGIDLQLVLAGDCLQPCSEKVLRGWIRSLGLDSVVEWRGCVEGESKKALFGQAELFLFPSLALESFGIVMVEAMMWGLPVMALDRRANYEVLCAPPEELRVRSPEVFAERLVEVIRERARWMEWGKENREKFLQNHLRRSGRSRLVEFLAQTANETT